MNGFRDDEVVIVQGRSFPIVGGRLRLAHESNDHLTIKTELVKVEVDQMAIVRATVTTTKGEFTGTGVATASRDPRLSDALVELAETRSIARALRLAGYGVEVCGLEELGDHSTLLGGSTRPSQRAVAAPRKAPAPQRMGEVRQFPRKPQEARQEPRTGNEGNGTGGNGGNGHGTGGLTVASAAQLRAIRTLARKAGTSADEACSRRFGHTRVEGLTIREASALIDELKAIADQPLA